MSTTSTQPADDVLTDFVALSAALTGIAASQLNPGFVDERAVEYCELAQAKGGATFAAMLDRYRANKTLPPDDIVQKLLADTTTPPDPPVKFLAQSVMLLWLLAAWFDPKTLADPSSITADFAPAHVIVSADAYVQGFVWNIAQTKPMGYSEWTFGYWAQDPPPLSEFIGGPSQ
jgi:hypothetical protein